MKAGAKVLVTSIQRQGKVQESATVCRVTRAMLPLPAGYVPVRFAAGAVVRAPLSCIALAA